MEALRERERAILVSTRTRMDGFEQDIGGRAREERQLDEDAADVPIADAFLVEDTAAGCASPWADAEASRYSHGRLETRRWPGGASSSSPIPKVKTKAKGSSASAFADQQFLSSAFAAIDRLSLGEGSGGGGGGSGGGEGDMLLPSQEAKDLESLEQLLQQLEHIVGPGA